MVKRAKHKLHKEVNHGFIPPEITSTDFWLGSKKLGSVVLNKKSDWRPYLPVMEQQRINFETNACVSFAITSALEMLTKLKYNKDKNA